MLTLRRSKVKIKRPKAENPIGFSLTSFTAAAVVIFITSVTRWRLKIEENKPVDMININPIWRGWINNWKKKRKLENFLFPKWLFLVFWFSRAVFTLWRFGRTQKAKHKWGNGGVERERTLSIDTQHAHKTHLWMLVITSLDWTGGPVHFAARTVKKRHTHTKKQRRRRDTVLRETQNHHHHQYTLASSRSQARSPQRALFVNAAAAAAVVKITKQQN